MKLGKLILVVCTGLVVIAALRTPCWEYGIAVGCMVYATLSYR